ncbi:MAG: hypothetical protein K6G26_12050 [Lachnospiraceae bacterium]|nr:hypothetical protein [Lachnospiraceae bacterium]
MSNKKVEDYKKQKYNRKKIQTRKKVGSVLNMAAFIAFCVGVVVLISCKIYDDYFKEKMIADIDVQNLYTAVTDVLSANTEEETTEETEENAETAEATEAPAETAEAATEAPAGTAEAATEAPSAE